jgi:DNA invertase Pin-like site-specific DNA recombinase
MPRQSAVGAKKSRRRVRCAIYTRKSTEEGLEQDFNSLDAQREACEAFILSQKHEGWVALPTPYEDGGYSGGTLQRPALQRLLADIRGSKADAVVVYKIDRLTRSLSRTRDYRNFPREPCRDRLGKRRTINRDNFYFDG